MWTPPVSLDIRIVPMWSDDRCFEYGENERASTDCIILKLFLCEGIIHRKNQTDMKYTISYYKKILFKT